MQLLHQTSGRQRVMLFFLVPIQIRVLLPVSMEISDLRLLQQLFRLEFFLIIDLYLHMQLQEQIKVLHYHH
jgi:hypothetical protein